MDQKQLAEALQFIRWHCIVLTHAGEPMHVACLELERQGLVRRWCEVDTATLWKAIPFVTHAPEYPTP